VSLAKDVTRVFYAFRQKMSRDFAGDLAKDVANTLRQEVTLLSTLYLLSLTVGNTL
jgi:hypothetical protein